MELFTKKKFLRVFSYWLRKAKILNLIKSQIAGKLEQLTKPYCDFCGCTFGLKCEVIDDITRIHKKFLKEYDFTDRYWRVDFWQNYFHKNCNLRTICYVCYQEIKDRTYEEVEEDCEIMDEDNQNSSDNSMNIVMIHRHDD